MFCQDTSLAGQSVQQWKLRSMAHEAALKEIAEDGRRKLLAYNKSCNRTDVRIGVTALFYKAQKKSAPRRRAPAVILDIGESSVTVKF